MSPSSHCESHQDTHQSGLGAFFLKIVSRLTVRGKRPKLRVRDLPPSLSLDIGLESAVEPDTFEGRWQEELRRMRR